MLQKENVRLQCNIKIKCSNMIGAVKKQLSLGMQNLRWFHYLNSLQGMHFKDGSLNVSLIF